jgi:hypothetical protein
MKHCAAFILAALSVLTPSLSWNLLTDEATVPNPGPRAGGTLLQWNGSIYLFGGRANEIFTIHDPKTYQIGKENGTLFFETYDQKHFKECFDSDGVGNNDRTSNLTADQFAECYNILVGTYFNDIWSYELNCTRIWDGPCLDKEWTEVSPNVRLGGCRIYNESELCTHPHERWEHSAAILTVKEESNVTAWQEAYMTSFYAKKAAYEANKSTTENDPYADDPYANPPLPDEIPDPPPPRTLEAWHIVYGGFARMCEDYCSDMWAFPLASCRANSTQCKWTQIATLGRSGPGKRWRMATATDENRWIVFGGHRLWQGFGQANSLANRWNNTERFEYGGYLDDLWIFSLNPEGPQKAFYADANMGVGHTIQFGREPDGGVYDLVFGPVVPTLLGAWQQILPREGCFRRPGVTWEERNDIVCTIAWPQARASASMVLVDENLLYLNGGFSSPFPYPHVYGRGAGPGTGSLASDSRSPYPSFPYYLNDMWRFDLRSGTWTELFPTGTNGVPAARRGHSLVLAGAALLLVGGYSQNVFFQDFWIYNLTTDRWLEKTYFPHPIYPQNCTSDVYIDDEGLEVPVQLSSGQARLSVLGEPTRGTVLDGLFGRANYDVFVQQARRQAAGWDGCRDRYDERDDLDPELVYLRPGQRGSHMAVFSEDHDSMYLYGGEALTRQERPLLSVTRTTRVVGELWAWNRNHCPKNCSGVGDCWYGHCYCYDGFYGIDCSNATCPGTYCHYDTDDHVQLCQHCCSAPYNHTDGDTYIENLRKVPCDETHFGLSHGICDGFGFCQCAPPFLTEDCSVKDCPNNCSAHGWCSVEYPVSRCMCDPPYAGNDCSSKLCLNNCSYPNGECVDGECVCASIKSPYNRTVFFDTYHGDDCSWIRPFAGAQRHAGAGHAAALVTALAFVLLAGGAVCGAGLDEEEDEEKEQWGEGRRGREEAEDEREPFREDHRA